MLQLPIVSQAQLNIPVVQRRGRPRRFMNPGEPEVLLSLVASVTPSCMVEIGVNEGGTAQELLQGVPSIQKYIGVDVPPGYKFTCKVQRNEAPRNPGCLVRDRSRFRLVLRPNGSRDLFPSDFPKGAVDVFFIDGDHSRQAVIHDTILARSVVRPGGLIIWHDYHDMSTVDVRDVLHMFHKSGEEIVHVENTWLAYQHVES